ncbi:L,D-transpeptidase family protein [Phenylobacterium sp.]|uniref:L,D-transpeptidase family protein n=1 Tax=Phenylobacterium sp. TaxID=1871053 RepID=UPI002ED7D314
MPRLPASLPRLVFAAVLTATAIATPACDRLPGAASSGRAADLKPGQVQVLLSALSEAPSHGFQPGAFGEQGLAERLDDGDRAARAQLRQAALAYARALRGYAIPRRAMDPAWGARSAQYDAEAEFTAAAQAGRLDAWAKALPPSSSQYQALRAAYADYQKIQAAGGWPQLSDSGTLRAGAGGPAVASLRARLAVEDPAADAGAGDRFDAALAEAVRRAQLRYGQHPTGEADADLRTALNTPVEARLAQIRANLERLRWLPRRLEADRIEANSAAGLVDVYRGGRPVLSMRAAAGKPGDETPLLASKVDRIVLNPTWNVPDSIANDEILPKGPGYLQRLGFVETAGEEGVRLVQQPGPENALGQVKFLFDNRYSVYLHDTPAKAAFAREQRSVSHGCVRLERALDLAQLLLSTQPGWSPDRIATTLASGETTEVKLDRPVQVILAYMTAFAQAGGVTAFRPDVYGWDAEVLRRLDAQKPGSA